MFRHWNYVLERLFGRVRTVTAEAVTHIPARLPHPLRRRARGGRPRGDDTPGAPAVIDWDATLAFRRHRWRHGLGVAMDTAQRGMGLDWAATAELIRRSAAEALATVRRRWGEHVMRPPCAPGRRRAVLTRPGAGRRRR